MFTSRAYRLAHEEVVAAQHEVAHAELARERSAWNGAEREPHAGQDADNPSAGGLVAETVEEQDPAEALAGPAAGASLVERFQALAPRPGSPNEGSARGESRSLKQRPPRARRRAEHVYRTFMDEGANLTPPLLAAMTAEERRLVEPVIIEGDPGHVLVGPVIEERLVYRPPGLRPRP